MSKQQQTYTREFKQEAVQLLHSSGKPLAQVARELGLAESTLQHWREQAFPGSGHQTGVEEENRRLRREVEVLKQERDILKKALHIFSRSQL